MAQLPVHLITVTLCGQGRPPPPRPLGSSPLMKAASLECPPSAGSRAATLGTKTALVARGRRALQSRAWFQEKQLDLRRGSPGSWGFFPSPSFWAPWPPLRARGLPLGPADQHAFSEMLPNTCSLQRLTEGQGARASRPASLLFPLSTMMAGVMLG